VLLTVVIFCVHFWYLLSPFSFDTQLLALKVPRPLAFIQLSNYNFFHVFLMTVNFYKLKNIEIEKCLSLNGNYLEL